MHGTPPADKRHLNKQQANTTDKPLKATPISPKVSTANNKAKAHKAMDARNTVNIQIRKNLPTYSPIVFNKTEERDNFIANLHNSHPTAKIVVIQDSSDFAKMNLLSNINLDENGNFATENGILFSDDPQDELILVLDFCNMDSTSRIEMHQLFDEDARFGKEALGNNITIISAVNTDLLLGLNANQQDFWRRAGRGEEQSCNKAINAQTNEEFFNNVFNPILDSSPKPKLTMSWKDKFFKPFKSSPNKTYKKKEFVANKLIINFANKNWQHELFGGPDLDENGKAVMFRGMLADLQENQEIVLLNAPWHDDNFNNELRRTITQKYYTNNKQKIALPNNISWRKEDLTAPQINDFKQQFNLQKASAEQNLSDFAGSAILNKLIFSRCFEKIGIDNTGKLVKHDALADWLEGADSILLTSNLTEAQWKQLLYHLQAIGKQNLPIIQYCVQEQPFIWRADKTFEQPKNIAENKNIIKSISPEEYYSKTKKSADESAQEQVIIEIVPDTNLENLCTDIELNNYLARTFKITQKKLLDALKTGKEVVLIGLESNPALARYLEPLLTAKPSLMLHGFKNNFDNIKLTLVLPCDEKLQSSLWQQLVPKDPLPQPTVVDLQVYARDTFNLNSEEQELSVKMVEQLDILIKTINITFTEHNLEAEKIIFNEYLIDKVWNQALTEKKLNNRIQLSVIDFQKSINTVISKSLRQNLKIHYYFKALTRNCFVTEQAAYLDTERIKNFVTENLSNLTPEFIEKNFWYLLKFFPEISNLTATKLDFPLENKAQSKWLIIRIMQAIFDTIAGLLIAAVNTLLHLVNFKKKKPEYNLTAMPDSISLSMRNDKEYNRILELVKAVIVNCVDEKDKLSVKITLDVTDAAATKASECQQKWQKLDTIVETTLRDLVYYAESLGLPAIKVPNSVAGIDDWCHQHALEITKIKNSNIPIDKKKQKVANIMTKFLPNELLKGTQITSNQETQVATNQEIIVDFLVEPKQQKLWVGWDARRHLRLTATTEAAGSINMLGDAATGKTRAAQKIAKGGPLYLINASPETGTTEFFGESVKTENDSDTIEFEFKENPATLWAKYRHQDSSSEEPITLVIDEDTLLKQGYIKSYIQSMKSKHSHISHNGEILPLTNNHRLIFSGNYDTSQGRTECSILKQLVPTICFKTLPVEYQNNVIIKPKINAVVENYGIKFNNSKIEAIDSINSMLSFLLNTYSKNLPENYSITTRDLNECCVLLDAYLWKLQQKGELDTQNISAQNIAPLIERAVKDAISGRIETDRWKLTAIKEFFERQFTTDDSLNNKITKIFEKDYNAMQLDFFQKNKNSDVDFGNKIIESMAYIVWIEMQKRTQEIATGIAHEGRRCREIKGDAGIGKDMIVGIMLRYLQQEDEHISAQVHNAGPKSWNSTIVPEINQAFVEGGVIAIAELNSLPSNIVEGTLNPLLANDKPKIGSLMFLTNNPTDFAGRNEPTFALNTRTNTLHVGQFDSNDLLSICKRVSNEQLRTKIVTLHCKLTELLLKNDLSPKPSLDQLKRLADYAENIPDISDQQLLEKFIEIYSFYINTGTKYTNKFTDQWQSFINNAKQGNFDFSSSLMLPKYYLKDSSLWLAENFTNLPEAIYVMVGEAEDWFDAKNNYIYLSKATLESSFEEKQKTITSILTETSWCDYGAPAISQLENDKYSPLYKQWIQTFAAEKINSLRDSPSYLKAELLFPISEQEQQKLTNIDDLRKVLLESLYKLKPTTDNRKKAEIIFDANIKETIFANTVRDITRRDTAIFKNLIQNNKHDQANVLLTTALQNKDLAVEYLQELIKIFKPYSEQLNQIVDYIHKNRYNYGKKIELNASLQFLVDYLKKLDAMSQLEFQNKVQDIATTFNSYTAKIIADDIKNENEDEDNLSEWDIERTMDRALDYELQKLTSINASKNPISSLFTGISNIASKAKSYISNKVTKDDGQSYYENPTNSIVLKVAQKIGVSFLSAYFHKIDGYKDVPYYDDFKKVFKYGWKNNKNLIEISDGISIDAYMFLYFVMKNKIHDSSANALNFFDQPASKGFKYNEEVEILRKLTTQIYIPDNEKPLLKLYNLENYDDYHVKDFFIKFMFCVQDDVSLNDFIAKQLTNGRFDIKHITSLLDFFVDHMNSQEMHVLKQVCYKSLASLYGKILQCCLHNLQKNINVEQNTSIIDALLNFKFLTDNLSSVGTNALAGILELNIPVLNDKITNLLNYRVDNTLNNQIKIDLPKQIPKVKLDAFKSIFHYTERTKEEYTIIQNVLNNLFKTTSKHLLEHSKKFTHFKTYSSWATSDKINLPQYIQGKPWFIHDKKDTQKAENIFITACPVINISEISNIFYHKPSGRIINFSDLLKDSNLLKDKTKPLLKENVKKFLTKQNLPLNDAEIILDGLLDTKDFDKKAFDKKYVNIPEIDINMVILRKMLDAYGSITFCLSSVDTSKNGFVTVHNNDELTQIINQTFYRGNTIVVDYHGRDNTNDSEYFDKFIKNKIENQYTDSAVFTVSDMQKITNEMFSQIYDTI